MVSNRIAALSQTFDMREQMIGCFEYAPESTPIPAATMPQRTE